MTSAHVALEAVNCPTCGSNDAVPEANGPDYDCHTTGDQTFDLCRCRSCDSYYLNPRPVTAALKQIYSSTDYYSYSFAEKANPIVLRARLARDLGKVVQMLSLSRAPIKDASALDIGAGDGSLLRAFESKGVAKSNLFGLELDEHAATKLNQDGFHGIHGRVESVDLPDGGFDFATMIQVIEHVAEPRDVLLRLHRALRDGGLLLLETPNMASWDRKFFRKRLWGGYHFPRHWTLWDTSSLPNLLKSCGFDVVHVSTPSAAVLWAWSLNHLAQHAFGNGRIARFFSMNNPFLLGLLMFLEFIPSRLGRSANMRVIARKRPFARVDGA